MDEKLTTAEQAFEEYWGTRPLTDRGIVTMAEWDTAKMVYVSAVEWATERTARRCAELCNSQACWALPVDCAEDIAKEFGL